MSSLDIDSNLFVARFVKAQKTDGVDITKFNAHEIQYAMETFMNRWDYNITDMGTSSLGYLVGSAVSMARQGDNQTLSLNNKQTIQPSGVAEIIDNLPSKSTDYRYIKKIALSADQGIEFDLRKSEFAEIDNATHCYYTGVELTNIVNTDNSRTMERIDPTKGYVVGNVVACCLKVNKFKGNTIDRFSKSSLDHDIKLEMARELVRQLEERQ